MIAATRNQGSGVDRREGKGGDIGRGQKEDRISLFCLFFKSQAVNGNQDSLPAPALAFAAERITWVGVEILVTSCSWLRTEERRRTAPWKEPLLLKVLTTSICRRENEIENLDGSRPQLQWNSACQPELAMLGYQPPATGNEALCARGQLVGVGTALMFFYGKSKLHQQKINWSHLKAPFISR